jgi:hypothetical protein
MMHGYAWLAGLVVLFASPCAARAQNTPDKQPGVTASQSPRDMIKHARKVARRTSKLRGLRMRRKVAMGVLTREAIVKRIEQKMAKEYTAAEIQREAEVYRVLGLLPAQLDYRGAVLALLKDQVAGFYDPAKRQLNLAAWLPFSMQEPALAHELCHALQDQHFRLKRFTRPIKENSDLQLARAALVEGDCTGVMIEYLLRDRGLDLGAVSGALISEARKAMVGGSSSAFKAAPKFLRETLVFPYIHGLAFMQRLRKRQSWRVVNAMFKRPPRSTEQILHYRKYWDRELPERVRSRKLSTLAGYEITKRDVLGEFQLGLYLEQGVGEAAARRAAAGWGGDLLEAYRKSGATGLPALVHLSSWDSEADAVEFTNAQRHVLAHQGRVAAVASSPQSQLAPPVQPRGWVYAAGKAGQGAGNQRWAVERRDRYVLVLHGVPAPMVGGIQQEIWKRWQVRGRRLPVLSAASKR